MLKFWPAALTALAFILISACGGSPETSQEENAPPAESFEVDPATAGSISGRVSFQGDPPNPRPINMGSDVDCRQLHEEPVMPETLVVGEEGGLRWVFVRVKSGLEGKTFAAPAEAVTMDQRGCIYRPHMVGIQANQTLKVTNSDPTLHNVHPLPRENSEWNRSQAAGAGAIEEKFPKPELMIPIKCNIHPWMRAWINVVENPFFAVTGEGGTFEIKGLPPGTYTLEAIHEQLGAKDMEVTLGAGETKSADFVFEQQG